RRLLFERRSMTVNRIALLVWNLTEIVDRLADNIHHASERAFTDGNADWTTGIRGLHAAHHAVSRQHRDGAHATFAQMLLHFGDHIDRVRHFEPVGRDAQRLINRRQILLTKLNVDDRPDDLHHFADVSVSAGSVG